MSTSNTVTGNPFKLKQCITLDLAKQIASAAAQEVILKCRQLKAFYLFIFALVFFVINTRKINVFNTGNSKQLVCRLLHLR